MKKKVRRRRCKNCDDLFKPDPRNIKRQKFCDKPECKVASKKHSQQKKEGTGDLLFPNAEFITGKINFERSRSPHICDKANFIHMIKVWRL